MDKFRSALFGYVWFVRNNFFCLFNLVQINNSQENFKTKFDLKPESMSDISSDPRYIFIHPKTKSDYYLNY